MAAELAPVDAIVIGASAGGVEALSAVLPALPQTYAGAVLVVLHLPRESPSLLADIFRPKCGLMVREARTRKRSRRGRSTLPPRTTTCWWTADRSSRSRWTSPCTTRGRPSMCCSSPPPRSMARGCSAWSSPAQMTTVPRDSKRSIVAAGSPASRTRRQRRRRSWSRPPSGVYPRTSSSPSAASPSSCAR